jgi:hypothetical protein
MTRAEHIAWCKQRALEYVERGELKNAVVSMLSDLRKHPETENHIGGEMGTMLLIGGHLNRTDEVRNWIEGFN